MHQNRNRTILSFRLSQSHKLVVKRLISCKPGLLSALASPPLSTEPFRIWRRGEERGFIDYWRKQRGHKGCALQYLKLRAIADIFLSCTSQLLFMPPRSDRNRRTRGGIGTGTLNRGAKLPDKLFWVLVIARKQRHRHQILSKNMPTLCKFGSGGV